MTDYKTSKSISGHEISGNGNTDYGFQFGPIEVVRITSFKDCSVVINLKTKKESIDIRSTAGGKLQFLDTDVQFIDMSKFIDFKSVE